MKVRFVVVDHENNISWSTKKEAGETFVSYGAAQKRAEELAGYSPGETIGVYEKVGEALAPVGKVKTARRK